MKIRLTEADLHRIVKESVKRILKEDYYSMQRPYGRRKLSDFSSDEAKSLNDYDSGFGVWRKHTFDGKPDTFEPAPLGNIPNNEPEFPEDEQPYQYWRAIRDFDERKPIDPSDEDKAYQKEKSWKDYDFDKFRMFDDDEGDDYNYNVHPNAFRASGAKRAGTLDAFDDSKRGDKVRRFNGTIRSIRQ